MTILSSLALILYFTLYAIIHSWLAGASVKQRVRQMFGPRADRYYRLGYNLFAVVTLVPMLGMMVLLPNQTLYVIPSPWQGLMVGGQLLAVGLALFSVWQTGLLHFLGLTQLFKAQPVANMPLNLGGFYAWVRHPLYTFALMFMWLSPIMSTNTLTTFMLFSLYFYFGSIYEERRLVAEFGSTYEAYRRQVPRLIPRLGHSYKNSE